MTKKKTIHPVKNACGRVMKEQIDPGPTKDEKAQMLKWFWNKCAYCRKRLTKGNYGYDHVVAHQFDGRNHISNRVPACKKCNEKEKLAKPWEEFLLSKTDPDEYDERHSLITGWVNQSKAPPLDSKKMEMIKRIIQESKDFLDFQMKRVKLIISGI